MVDFDGPARDARIMTRDDKLPLTIRHLLRPDAYPHPTSGPVVLVQTHISYVLLTGPYVYKVKKPVDLGFVDFSTLERRRHFCEEEVRLNRRGAPGLYLGVVPIARGDGAGAGLVLGGSGRAVEYAVKMRQFPEEGVFSRLLARGALGESDVEQLAATVAAYHADAPRQPTGRFGRPDDLLAGIREDHRQSERFFGRFQTRDRLDVTDAFTERFVSSHRDLLAARLAGGHVRECHGDLHLGNICRWEDRTLLFDCIEFNERYRWIDTMHDAAFTAMDLEARGRRDLATAFINAYAELTGDWDGLRLLPLYLCRYAYVRAKVSSMLADEPEAEPSARESAGEAAKRYYELAHAYASPRGRGGGRLLVMCGPSGSGKSTIARALARRLGAAHVRSDAVRKHLAGVPLRARAGADVYAPVMTERTYARLLELGTALAAEGHTVILDARYSRRAQRGPLIEAAAARGIPLRILHCTLPPELLVARLDRRQGDVSDATAELLEAQKEEAEPFAPAELEYLLRLDSTRPAEALAAEFERSILSTS
jgi:aminoglycoside phosphotransferase family enzyme/predicted kinase